MASLGDRRLDLRLHGRIRRRREHVRRGLSDQHLARQPGQPLVAGVDVDHREARLGRVGDHDSVLDGLHGALAKVQRLFGFLAVRDVEHHTARGAHAACLVERRLGLQVGPADPAVLMHDPDVDRERLTGEDPLVDLVDQRPVLRQEQPLERDPVGPEKLGDRAPGEPLDRVADEVEAESSLTVLRGTQCEEDTGDVLDHAEQALFALAQRA